jgi:hypothetical protein
MLIFFTPASSRRSRATCPSRPSSWRASTASARWSNQSSPERTLDTLFGFLRQNNGRLSKHARENEFAALTDDEARRIEQSYGELFGAP